MFKIIKNAFLFCAIIFTNNVIANNPIPPPTNIDCNSSVILCETNPTHSFGKFSSENPCIAGNVKLYYYVHIASPVSFEIDFTNNMNGYQFYGPLSSNLPDACEQFSQNNFTLVSSSNVSAASYTLNNSNTIPQSATGLFLIVINVDQCVAGTISLDIRRGDFLCAPQVPCENCVPSFELEPEKKYMLSAWTKEEGALPTKTSYNQPMILLSFPSVSSTPLTFVPSGVIIDGWQRIEAEFEVPAGATNMQLELMVTTGEAYFDDIRIFPFDGSMKSYVYDPITLRLMAELDERNYATIYEYDEEGKLVRVKKETERGIMTIQENKTFIKK